MEWQTWIIIIALGYVVPGVRYVTGKTWLNKGVLPIWGTQIMQPGNGKLMYRLWLHYWVKSYIARSGRYGQTNTSKYILAWLGTHIMQFEGMEWKTWVYDGSFGLKYLLCDLKETVKKKYIRMIKNAYYAAWRYETQNSCIWLQVAFLDISYFFFFHTHLLSSF